MASELSFWRAQAGDLARQLIAEQERAHRFEAAYRVAIGNVEPEEPRAPLCPDAQDYHTTAEYLEALRVWDFAMARFELDQAPRPVGFRSEREYLDSRETYWDQVAENRAERQDYIRLERERAQEDQADARGYHDGTVSHPDCPLCASHTSTVVPECVRFGGPVPLDVQLAEFEDIREG